MFTNRKIVLNGFSFHIEMTMSVSSTLVVIDLTRTFYLHANYYLNLLITNKRYLLNETLEVLD